MLNPLNSFLFVGFPYLVLILAVVVSILRFKVRPFTYSSLSSQFLENGQLFWGSNFFHWGLLTVLSGHLIGFLFPKTLLAWNAVPLRLLIFELAGLIAALLCLIGLVILIARRVSNPRVKVVTTAMDKVLLGALLVQVALGIDLALRYRWGSSWFATNASPYLWSLLAFRPRPEFILPLPWTAKLHLLLGFGILGLLPFTRLVHVLVVPFQYLWRKPQVVIWNRRPASSARR